VFVHLACMTDKLHILKHPLADHALTDLRDRTTPVPRFRQRVQELSKFLLLEATRDLPTVDVAIETPLTTTLGQRLGDYPIVVAPILRAGLAMVQPAMELLPEAEIRHIGLYRDEETLQPVHYYVKVPDTYPDNTVVFVIDPMLATGGSALDAVSLFEERGVRDIRFLCLIASPEGIERVMRAKAALHIYTVSVDERLNDQGYIVPGLGDAGDRTFGTL
jgi:uracil phosphoribosyltransferase